MTLHFNKRTRQIIRYRATATLRRPQKSNIQPQNRGELQNQQEYHIIFTKFEAVHQTAVWKLRIGQVNDVRCDFLSGVYCASEMES